MKLQSNEYVGELGLASPGLLISVFSVCDPLIHPTYVITDILGYSKFVNKVFTYSTKKQMLYSYAPHWNYGELRLKLLNPQATVLFPVN